jgi:CubicO group peptidase (beta-lactamase class C family)
MPVKHLFLIIFILLSTFAGCTPQPGASWTVSSPQAEGMDPEPLAAMEQALENYPQADFHSLLVVRNGAIVAEKYGQGYNQDSQHMLYSCTKSVISALVGIAIEEGYIKGVDQPVSGFFPEALLENSDTRKRGLTLEHLLTMRAGLEWDEGNPAYRSLYNTRDWVAFMLAKPLETEPGSAYNYCSGCTHVLSGVLHKATGMPTQEYAETRLFAPLGIQDYRWETDAVGNAIGGWGLELTTRDMAKFGLLFLNGGVWEGQQVVPASWVEQSTGPGLPSDGNWLYAYQWWVNPTEQMYAAQGLHGQKIYVLPAEQMVVVVTSGADDRGLVSSLVLNAALDSVK